MKSNPKHVMASLCIAVAIFIGAFAGCASSPAIVVTPMLPTTRPQLSTALPTKGPTLAPKQTLAPTATPIVLPEMGLKTGDFYFRVDGVG